MRRKLMKTATKLLVCALFLCVGFASSFFGQSSAKNETANKDAEELLNIERKLSEAIAKHNTKFLDQLYAEDFRGLTSYGYETNKAKLMEVFKLDDSKIKYTIDDLLPRVFKDTAIVTGRHTGKTAEGEIVSQSRFIHVYIKRDGRWQMVAGQGTFIRVEGQK
jgi:hypothetical protein